MLSIYWRARREPTRVEIATTKHPKPEKEELRAVGVGKYEYRKTRQPSENSIRQEHGLPVRKNISLTACEAAYRLST
ncbi:type III secretion system effector protein [Xanthomonas phaseoli pv. phaseoli]|nr:type III secretion system effector protein [Xanthomonas phaseoli pv. phaseoli]